MAHYFVRHGQSVANLEGVFAGQKNNALLTELGKEQAKTAGEKLKAFGITRIISSPLDRAFETAVIISSELGGLEIQVDERLFEYDMGALTSQPNRAISSLELVAAQGAEEPGAFAKRVVASLIEHSDDTGNTLFVSHACVARIIECVVGGTDLNLFYDLVAPGNSEVIEIDVQALKTTPRSRVVID